MARKRYKDGFSFSELFANSNGKTSGSGVIGFFTVIVGLLCFISGAVFVYISCWHNCEVGAGSTLMNQSIALIVTGSTLLGVRKFTKDNDIEDGTEGEI